MAMFGPSRGATTIAPITAAVLSRASPTAATIVILGLRGEGSGEGGIEGLDEHEESAAIRKSFVQRIEGAAGALAPEHGAPPPQSA
jgi:hypothetical protein